MKAHADEHVQPYVTPPQAEHAIRGFLANRPPRPYLLIAGGAVPSMRLMPPGSIDTVITSPPYWRQRDYANPDSLGNEPSIQEYVTSLLEVFSEVRRILRPAGSFWLNIGDSYRAKGLCSIPWRVAIALQDSQGWILRNDIVWNKLKGAPDNAKDKLRNVHEYVFHFVKQKDHYYDDRAVRNRPRAPSIRDGRVVTATGVSGINYRRQIQRSTALTDREKVQALAALEETIRRVAAGDLNDFRMIIRGQQRITHSDSIKVSGRAGELARKGFYILPYDKHGTKFGDVWDIIPEDRWRTDIHCAPFPEELCAIPIEATSPPDGVVLDPFAGTGTTVLAAIKRHRRAIGIDISREYLHVADTRLQGL